MAKATGVKAGSGAAMTSGMWIDPGRQKAQTRWSP
ncbi:hypothetical protein EPYR_01803 [Erwinia pyrifoliae DSM 12163]|nr:hypothetical protein EPYR_01803 [Erwinia pyrifoliae DSM 12163]